MDTESRNVTKTISYQIKIGDENIQTFIQQMKNHFSVTKVL
jgi:hypothetical protein